MISLIIAAAVFCFAVQSNTLSAPGVATPGVEMVLRPRSSNECMRRKTIMSYNACHFISESTCHSNSKSTCHLRPKNMHTLLRPVSYAEKSDTLYGMLSIIGQRVAGDERILKLISEIQDILKGLDKARLHFVERWPRIVAFFRKQAKYSAKEYQPPTYQFFIEANLQTLKEQINMALEKYPVYKKIDGHDIYVIYENASEEKAAKAVTQLSRIINLLDKVLGEKITATHFIELVPELGDNVEGETSEVFPGSTGLKWPLNNKVEVMGTLLHENDHHDFFAMYHDGMTFSSERNKEIPAELLLNDLVEGDYPYDYIVEARGYLRSAEGMIKLANYYLRHSNYSGARIALTRAKQNQEAVGEILAVIIELKARGFLSDLGNETCDQLSNRFSTFKERFYGLVAIQILLSPLRSTNRDSDRLLSQI